MTARCRWMFDRVIGRWFLPGCWGGVNAGPDGCYCRADKGDEDDLRERIATLEARLKKLERRRP